MTSAPAVPKLLVVTIDRLPAWILPAFGSAWVATPAIDALAGRGLTFDRLVVTGDDDIATLRALGIGSLGAEGMLVTDAPRVATAATAATVRVVDMTPVSELAADPAATNVARLSAAAGEAITSGRHPLVWVHAESLGVAWDAPARFREAYTDPADPHPFTGAVAPNMAVDDDTDPDVIVGIRQAFAGQLTHLDACLGPLLEAARGWTVLLAGIRGMGLGLHGRVGPGPLPPFSELVHVPAILADAGGRMAGQRYGGLIVPADLGATLADLQGVAVAATPVDEPWRGRSLAGLLVNWSAATRDRIVVAAAHGAAIVTPGWHLVAGAAEQARLFHKPDDFFELCDVADRCPAVVEELGPLATAAAAGDVGRGWLASLSAASLGGG